MDAFEKELMRRSPLAACVLETADFIFDATLARFHLRPRIADAATKITR